MTGMQRAKRFVFGWISVFIVMRSRPLIFCFFFFNDTATTEIYTLSLHDALPIFGTKANRLHLLSCFVYVVLPDPDKPQTMMRSEEHTSELQSQSNLVCRLLLEKKKTISSPPRTSHRLTMINSTSTQSSCISTIIP